MFRKILPFLMGFLPSFAASAAVNPVSGVWDNAGNTGAEITSGYYNYTSAADMIVNGAFIVDSTADSGNPTVAAAVGAFITNYVDSTNNGNLSNAAAGGLSINAAAGIRVAELIANSGGTMTLNPGAGQTITASGILSGDPSTTLTSDGTIIISSGSNIVLGGSPNIVPGQYYGLYSTGGIYVGMPSPNGGNVGDIVFSSTVDKTIAIQSDGDIHAAGNLEIASGYDFFMGTKTGLPIAVDIGGFIDNSGILTIGGASDSIGSITIGGNVNSAGTSSNPASISLTTNTGNISFQNATNRSYSSFAAIAAGNLSFTSFDNFDSNSGNVTLTAQSGGVAATNGIVNKASGASASMLINAGTTLSVGGDLDNSGAKMSVLAPGGVAIAGTIKNDMVGGMLTLGTAASQLASLTVSGGTASTTSFENLGVFSAHVSGVSTFAYGISNLTAPSAGSLFLQTGSLVFTNDPTFVIMNNFMQNALNGFTLNITNADATGNLSTQSITNGQNVNISNAGANMDVSAYHIAVGTNVTNTGATMNLIANAADATAMTIGGNVSNGTNTNAASEMNLETVGTLAIGGNVINYGTMGISGESALSIGSNVISTGNMQLLSSNATGMITITGNVVNGGGVAGAGPCTNGADCNMFISARGLNITGTLGNSFGNTRVLASDNNGGNIMIGGLGVSDGWMGVNILTGLSITSGINVSGGTLAITAADNVIVGTGVANSGTLSISAADTLSFANGGVTTGADSSTTLSASVITGRSITNGGTFAASAPQGITLTAGNIQNSGNMTLNTTALTITSGSIVSNGNLLISSGNYMMTGPNVNMPAITASAPDNWTPWLDVDVFGDVMGAVRFVGLGNMEIGGNYQFSDASGIHAAVLPASYNSVPGRNYYATVDNNPASATYGQINNADQYGHAASSIINVSGVFITDLSGTAWDIPNAPAPGADIAAGEIGISIFDIIDNSDAVWLLHADGGIVENGLKMRNLFVQFCNVDGTSCFDYLTALRDPVTGLAIASTNPNDLPAYLSVRNSEDVYIVFDPEFGGPIKVFGIQPIVAREPTHTTREYVSAGALDDLVDGELRRAGFIYNNPIEAIPMAFQGTIFQAIGNEIYNRMEQYLSDRGTNYLTEFSRLFIPWELDLIAADVTMSEHTNGRAFANRMMDELLWNRNRNLTKVWGDFSYGWFDQQISDPKNIQGTRFELSGGFDIQRTKNNIYGLMARISRMTSSVVDTMDLSYSGLQETGNVDVTVTGTNIGLGGYMLHRFNNDARLYGNFMLNIDMFDIERTQNFIDKIDGFGSAFSVTTEWGILHDIWLQYFVGNLYARLGYNFGLDATTTTGGVDYMKYESDGYFILTPGYALNAQKKVYLSPWLVLRPYAGVGLEYDLGGFDSVNYKFAPALGMTKYNTDMSPLWASVRVGADLTNVAGWNFGLEYEYKYNDVIKLNNIRFSGSYRF